MTIPTAPPPPADPDTPVDGAAPSGRTAPRGAERFLLWVAGLGVARSDGWLGGVAAGIAARLRIDPLIVRGVLVVAALFGLPVIFLYAVAWALLPDTDGRVHLRDLLERRYEPVQLGILAMAIVGLLPTAPLTGRLFGLGYESWSALSLFSWIVGLVLAAGLLFLIVRAASRTPGASAPDLPMASAGQAAPGASAPLAGSGPAEGRTPPPSRRRRSTPRRRPPRTPCRSPTPASSHPPLPRPCRPVRTTPPRSRRGARSTRPGRSRTRRGGGSSRTRSVPPGISCDGSARPRPRCSPRRPPSDDASAGRRTRVPVSPR